MNKMNKIIGLFYIKDILIEENLRIFYHKI